jgi:hypothetical protein
MYVLINVGWRALLNCYNQLCDLKSVRFGTCRRAEKVLAVTGILPGEAGKIVRRVISAGGTEKLKTLPRRFPLRAADRAFDYQR